MTIEFIKTGMNSELADETDTKVRETVEQILKDVRSRGDVAVRELSENFDKWSPENFQWKGDPSLKWNNIWKKLHPRVSRIQQMDSMHDIDNFEKHP